MADPKETAKAEADAASEKADAVTAEKEQADKERDASQAKADAL